MYTLVIVLTQSHLAALVAGLACAFAPERAADLSHLQMLLVWGMPLALAGLHWYLETRRTAALVVFAAGWLITALSNGYLLVFFGIYLLLWIAWFLHGRERRSALRAVLLTWSLSIMPLVPVLWTYRVVHATYGFARGYGATRTFGASVEALLAASPRLTLLGPIVGGHRPEAALFPGFTIALLAAALAATGIRRCRTGTYARISVALVLAAAALVAIGALRLANGASGHKTFSIAFVALIGALATSGWFRRALHLRDPVVFYAASAVVMWLLALGPEPHLHGVQVLYKAPYALLFELPFANAIRVPARSWAVVTIALAVLVGFAVARLMSKGRRSGAVLAVAIAAVIAAEGWFRFELAGVPLPRATGVIPEDAVVLELPIGRIAEDVAAQYRATIGRYRVVNGYSGYEPPAYRHRVAAVERRDPAGLTIAGRRTDLYVIVDRGLDDGALAEYVARQPGAARLVRDEQIEVLRVPAR